MTATSPRANEAGADAPAGDVEAPERPHEPARGYIPSLDGIRALAVAAVLLFHSQFSWAKGGFLGVSTFFTLSGFLITSLLLGESGRHGQPDLKRFWARRARRLLPASLLAITLALLVTAIIDNPTQRALFAGDAVTSFFDVANWHFYIQGTSYGNLFADPSALLHFWSLSIEEQFYLFIPPVVWLVARRRGTRFAFLAAFASLAVISLIMTFVFSGDPDRVYFGTDTRSFELLAGAILAVGVHRYRVLTHRGVAAATRVLGPVALGASVLCWIFIGQQDPILYEGGLALYALLSTAVVAAAFLPGGPFVAALAWGPLRQLGRISYGVYVYHWPIFLLLTPERVGIDGLVLFLVRVGVTLALAITSFHLIEQPVRAGTMLPRRPLIPYLVAAVVVTAISIILSVTAPANELEFLESGVGTNATVPTNASGRSANTRLPKFGFFGDSTALSLALGFDVWADQQQVAAPSGGVTKLGCGLVRSTHVRIADQVSPAKDECLQWHDEWDQAAARSNSAFNVVMVGPWDTGDHQLSGSDTWVHFGDPAFDQAFANEMRTVIDLFQKRGQKTVWVTSPLMTQGSERDERRARGQSADPERMRRLNEIVKQVAAERPDWVRVVDLAAWMEQDVEGRSVAYRPDGLHFSNKGALDASTQFFGPAVMAAVPGLGATGASTTGDKAQLCTRLSVFGLQELQAATALTGSATDKANVGAGLQAAAAEVKKVAPDLGPAVDARVTYWTGALTSGAAVPPAETSASATANQKLDSATKSTC